MSLGIKRPTKWVIEIEEVNGEWHEKYIELFPSSFATEEDYDHTIKILEPILKGSGLSSLKIKRIKEENTLGICLECVAPRLEPIANQIVSEFIGMSELGKITLLDLLTVGVLTLGTARAQIITDDKEEAKK